MANVKQNNSSVKRKKKNVFESHETDDIQRNVDNSKNKNDNLFAEPLTHSVWKRAFQRTVISFIVILLVYYSTKNTLNDEIVMASVKDNIIGSPKGQEIKCSDGYAKDMFKECAPNKCGRIVTDAIVDSSEAERLLSLAKSSFSLGGSSDGTSVIDLHSGVLSNKINFVNIYKLIKAAEKRDIFTDDDFKLYRKVKNKIHQTVSMQFGVMPHKLFLTKPTFFSRITSSSVKTIPDQHEKTQIDRETHKSYFYTSILYLSNYGKDFTGGRFIFTDTRNVTVEPKFGRLSAFTSSSENTYFLENVKRGTLYALTISFTCDPNQAIDDPKIV